VFTPPGVPLGRAFAELREVPGICHDAASLYEGCGSAG